ncbi:unnamed protein product [Effrenium voratum]|uniref:Uncharacterized protein n=1 Tax=Effrenium voratum TaxID=2562239 RepID=A0AA36IZV6_9DINO|nr:unnamed protein product [Effrenium voratum]
MQGRIQKLEAENQALRGHTGISGPVEPAPLTEEMLGRYLKELDLFGSQKVNDKLMDSTLAGGQEFSAEEAAAAMKQLEMIKRLAAAQVATSQAPPSEEKAEAPEAATQGKGGKGPPKGKSKGPPPPGAKSSAPAAEDTDAPEAKEDRLSRAPCPSQQGRPRAKDRRHPVGRARALLRARQRRRARRSRKRKLLPQRRVKEKAPLPQAARGRLPLRARGRLPPLERGRLRLVAKGQHQQARRARRARRAARAARRQRRWRRSRR